MKLKIGKESGSETGKVVMIVWIDEPSGRLARHAGPGRKWQFARV